MVHSGYEASAVNDTFGSLKGFLATVESDVVVEVLRSGGAGGAAREGQTGTGAD